MTVTENLEMGAFQRTDRENFQSDMDRVFELSHGSTSGGRRRRGRCPAASSRCARSGARSWRGQAAPARRAVDGPRSDLRREDLEIVVEINAQGTPVLLVEQNALMALDTAHRAYVMETGRITLEGPASSSRRTRGCRRPTWAWTDPRSAGSPTIGAG